MVKKLFKHEVNAYLRTILPMHLILVIIALFGRVVQFFENDSITYKIVFWSSVIAFIVGAVVCTILTIVFVIRRFYSNLFTSEGYLSFTLPVTPTQHIIVKNIVAVISQLFSIVMIFLAFCVITAGDVLTEIFKAAGYILKLMYSDIGQNTTLFIFEFAFALILSISSSFMLFYACIALGQRAKKNRVAAAVGVFFIYYFIIQALSTLLIIFVAVFYEQLNIEAILLYLSEHQVLTEHLFNSVAIVICLAEWIICYFITKSTIKNKLNLE